MREDFRTLLHRFLQRLDVHDHSIVVVSFGSDIKKVLVKPILEELIDYLKHGTLCVVGDCTFNTNATDIEMLLNLSNRERLVLTSDYALQILSLRHDAHRIKHPSLSIGCVGQYARYLTRHQHLDFPFGSNSFFDDLIELNATHIFIGEDWDAPALKYVEHLNDQKVIMKNVCVLDNTVHGYLDFESNSEYYSKLITKHNLLLSEHGVVSIYGESYLKLISALQ